MEKRIIDEDGIVYKEVDYNTYLKSKNKHRIIKHLEAQYFIQEDTTTNEK